MKAKYIIIQHDGCEAVIVFSPFLLHQDVAQNSQVKSAGFCKLDENGRWTVSGGSFSLNQSVKATDVNALNALLPLGGSVLQSTTPADCCRPAFGV
jgi:hypothetical protein